VSSKRRLKSAVLKKIPPIVAFLTYLWGKSCARITVVNGAFEAELALSGRGCVYVTWHQRLLNLFFLKYRRPVTIMISRSKDGDLVAAVAEKLGFGTVRGSSSRGGATAMYQLIDKIREIPATSAGMLGDGPRGPARKLKLGTLKIAQETGVPIIPFAYSAKHHKLFASWDRFMMPFPFSPLVVCFGDPIKIPAAVKNDELENLRLKVESSLDDLTSCCDDWWQDS
jgi:lysophospholipid acyltransferase (LPLAT)-like uncharacterized protein